MRHLGPDLYFGIIMGAIMVSLAGFLADTVVRAFRSGVGFPVLAAIVICAGAGFVAAREYYE